MLWLTKIGVEQREKKSGECASGATKPKSIYLKTTQKEMFNNSTTRTRTQKRKSSMEEAISWYGFAFSGMDSQIHRIEHTMDRFVYKNLLENAMPTFCE